MEKNKSKIDKIDKKILYELDKNSKAPISQLSKKLRISREILKYRMKKLVDSKIIVSFTTMVNPSKFGYLIYKLYLKIPNLNRSNDAGLIQFLNNNKNVFWLARCDGNYDLIVGVYVQTIVELDNFLLNLNQEFGKDIISRQISNTVYVNVNYKDYLANEIGKSIFWGGVPNKENIDKTSQKILHCIAENSRMPVAQICKMVDSTPKTIISKIKKMEKEKVILGYRIIIDFEKLNMENFKAIIYFQNIDPKKEKEFKEFCRINPNVCYCIKTIGEWDFELDIEVKNYKSYNKLIQTIKEKFGNSIKSIDSVFLREELKGELNIAQKL